MGHSGNYGRRSLIGDLAKAGQLSMGLGGLTTPSLLDPNLPSGLQIPTQPPATKPGQAYLDMVRALAEPNLLSGLQIPAPQPSSRSTFLGGGLAINSTTDLLLPVPPSEDKKKPRDWTTSRKKVMGRILENLQQKLAVPLKRIGVARNYPRIDAMSIGSAKKFTGVAVFFDIVGSTKLQLRYQNQPEIPFYITSYLCTAIMKIVDEQRGMFEKNTGDGVLAYFSATEYSPSVACQDAVNAALIVKDQLVDTINPHFSSLGYPTVQLRVGLELGEFLVGKIGLPESHKLSGNMLVAQGAIPNIASKLCNKAQPGQIMLGQNAYSNLPEEYQKVCVLDTAVTQYLTSEFDVQHRAYELDATIIARKLGQ